MAWPQRQGTAIIVNIFKYTPDNTLLYPKRLESSATLLWTPQILCSFVSLLEHLQFCTFYFSAQLWHITVEVVVWTHHDDMLEFQHQAPQVVRPQRLAAVHIGVTHSFGTLPLVPVTTIPPVTCHHISEALMLDFTDTGKVTVRHW